MSADADAVGQARAHLHSARQELTDGASGGPAGRPGSRGAVHLNGTGEFPRSRTMRILLSLPGAAGAAGLAALVLLLVCLRPGLAYRVLRSVPMSLLLRAAVVRTMAAHQRRSDPRHLRRAALSGPVEAGTRTG